MHIHVCTLYMAEYRMYEHVVCIYENVFLCTYMFITCMYIVCTLYILTLLYTCAQYIHVCKIHLPVFHSVLVQ